MTTCEFYKKLFEEQAGIKMSTHFPMGNSSYSRESEDWKTSYWEDYGNKMIEYSEYLNALIEETISRFKKLDADITLECEPELRKLAMQYLAKYEERYKLKDS